MRLLGLAVVNYLGQSGFRHQYKFGRVRCFGKQLEQIVLLALGRDVEFVVARDIRLCNRYRYLRQRLVELVIAVVLVE